MKRTKDPPTYEGEVLAVLAFEFRPLDRSESDRKIKRRLRDKKLGSFDQKRIETIRALKDDVLQEVSGAARSKFWLGANGPYTDMKDWDLAALLSHFERRHPNVPKEEISRFLPYAIYLYYLR